MTDTSPTGPPPATITTLLRLEGLGVLAACLIAYHALGGNWWLFALLILAPDLAFLLKLMGDDRLVGRAYNLAHTSVLPVGLGLIAYLAGWTGALPYLIIWLAHIGADRALGYGLKYPGTLDLTHLGPIGRAKKALRG
jgi:hypothetical protein